MYQYDEIRHVHLEPTTGCNAGCPMCARNVRGAVAPGLQLTEIGIGDARAIFPETFLRQLTGFDMCGAYGDPAAARDLAEIVSYLRAAGPDCMITIFTNGGLRSSEWWREFAERLGIPGRVVFAIDGLADTNHIYRRGVNFEKVMENARAFIGAGGDARWDFLAFRHNEHQVDQARALSIEMGFRDFSVKKTDRFLEPRYDYVPEFAGLDDFSRFPILQSDGSVSGYLEPPLDPTLVNETALHQSELLRHYSSLDDLFDKTPIHCRVLDTASVFVSAKGFAFPCCWTYVQATRPEISRFPQSSNRQMVDLVASCGGFARIDARRIGLRAAVESELFAAIESSWSCGSIEEGRLKVCARACGEDFPAYFNQFADASLVPRSLRLQSVPRA